MCQLTLLLVVLGSLPACSGEEGIVHSYVQWSNDLDYLLRQPKETWVKLYRKLEDALLNSPELLDNLREKFFPSRSQYRAKDPTSIDGIQVAFLPICVMFSNRSHGSDHFNGNNSLNGLITRCMNFRWTNSRLLNIIPVDQLSALDPFWTKMLYSAIVSSRLYGEHVVITLELNMDDIDTHYYMTLNEEDIVVSMAILLSWVSRIGMKVAMGWSIFPNIHRLLVIHCVSILYPFSFYFLQSKNLALDRTGEHWSQENQGYVVPWYDYYTTDNRYQEDSLTIEHIIVYLNCLFVAMNAFVLLLLARYSTKIVITIGQLCHSPNFTSSIHKGALCTATLFVTTYLLAVLVYNCLSGDFQLRTTDPIFRDKIKARIASLCIWVGVLIFAGTVYTGIAVYSTLTVHRWKIFKYQFLDVIVLWGTFMFCQLWIGVFSIPIVTFLAISPTITLFHLCSTVLIYIHLIAPIAYIIHYFNRSSIGLKCIQVTLSYITYYLATSAVTISASVIYFEVMIRGAVPHGAQGFFLSFIPPLILSLTLWLIKTKLFTDKRAPYASIREKITYMV